MSKTQNLNLPITILHEVTENNTQYKISGTLMQVNESMNTATVKFRNGRVENIPLCDIYINEGLLDTIKKLGKKIAGWVVKKVKGFIAFLNPDGSVDVNAMQNPYNMVIAQSKGEFPNGITMYPCEPVVDFIEENGISVKLPDADDMLNDSINNEADEANRYFGRIMKVAATTDKTIEESIDYVRNRYYKTSKLFEAVEADMSKKLNEDVPWSLDAPVDKKGHTDWGMMVNTEELKEAIRVSIDEQLALTKKFSLNQYQYSEEDGFSAEELELMKQFEEGEEDEINNPTPNRPLLVWGAPGIGKSQIFKQVLKEFRDDKRNDINLNIITVVCSVIEKGDIQVPTEAGMVDPEINIKQIQMAPQKWLPCYMKTGNAVIDNKCENYFAKCMHLKQQTPGEPATALLDAQGREFQGGVLFFDEISRLDRHAQSTMMGIVQREVGVMSIARSWAVCAASNRDIDDDIQDSAEAMKGNALVSRFDHVLYVPKMEEWLEWGRSLNKKGLHKIAPEILDFIEFGGEKIWYMAVMHGSIDKRLDLALKAEGSDLTAARVRAKNSREMYDYVKGLEDYNPLGGTKEAYNGRTWEDISKAYYDMLTGLLTYAPKGYDAKSCLLKSKVRYKTDWFAPQALKESFAHLPHIAWVEFAKKYLPKSERIPSKIGPLEGLNLVHKALIRIVQKKTGSAKSLPTEEMKQYFKWQEMFNDAEICNSIFNTGALPAEYREKDEAGRSEQGGFEWKDDTATIQKVINYIMSQYPGDSKKDVSEFIDYVLPGLKSCLGQMKTVAHKANSSANVQKIDEIIEKSFDLKLPLDDKKLVDFFTVKTDKFGSVVIYDSQKLTPIIRHLLYNIIMNNDFIRFILNYCKYICQICFSINNFELFSHLVTASTLKDLIVSSLGISNQQTVSDLTMINKLVSGILAENTAKYPQLNEMKLVEPFLLFKTVVSSSHDFVYNKVMGVKKPAAKKKAAATK